MNKKVIISLAEMNRLILADASGNKIGNIYLEKANKANELIYVFRIKLKNNKNLFKKAHTYIKVALHRITKKVNNVVKFAEWLIK